MPPSAADSVKVAVRVRPFKDYEIEAKSKCIVQMNGPQTILIEPSTGKETKFTFDFSYWSFNSEDANFANNTTLWNDMGENMLANCWQGYNTSMFAYGQTGSGKSYSMIGYPGKDEGLVTMAAKRIFQKIEESKSQSTGLPVEYGVEASMLEIYNEEIKDLFNPKNNPTGGLKIRENPQTGVYVEGLSKHVTQGEDQILKLLKQGEDARTTGATKMNQTSSRAHTVFILYFKQTVQHPETKQKVQKVSSINLIDLAGSERMAKTGATGARAQEGININLSLTSLGNVIKALADKCTGKNATAFIPYRDSKLTHILKESLGGNSRTIMIAAISPADVNFDESLSTLRYADRAKQIVNKAIVNEDPSAKIISQLRAEIEKLKSQLTGKGIVPATEGGESQVTGGIAQAEFDKLKEQLEESQRLMAEMQMTTEEKIRQTEEMAKDTESFFKDMSVEVNVDKTKVHVSNINEDPLLSGKLNYYVQEPTNIGSGEKNNIKIFGAGILEAHAVIRGGMLVPLSGAKVYHNGVEITTEVKIKNGDRMVFGTRLIYQYNNPNEGPIAECEYKVAWEEFSKNLIDEKTTQLVQEHKRRELELQETISSVKSEIEKQRQEQRDVIQKEIETAKQREDQVKNEFAAKEKLLMAELQAVKNDEQKRKQIEQMLESEKKKNEEQVLKYQRELEATKLQVSSTYQKQVMELESKLMAEVNIGKKHKEDLEKENQALQLKISEKEAEYERKISEEKDFLQKKEQSLLDEKLKREVEIQKLISENQHNGALVSQYQEEMKREKERIDALIKSQAEVFAQSEERIRTQINSEVTVLKEKLEKSQQAEEEAKKYKEQLSKVEEEMTKKNKEHEDVMQREKEKFSMREKELLGAFQAKERDLLAKIESGATEEEVNELRNQLISEKQEKQKQLDIEREEYERKLGENRLKMTAVRAILKTQIQKSNTLAVTASTKAEEKITLLQQKYLEEKMAQQEEIERQKLEMERQQQELARGLALKQSELLLNAEKDTKAMLEQMRLIELEREEKEREFQRKELEMSMKLFDMENRLQMEMSEKSQLIIEKAVKTTVIASTNSSNSVGELVPWIQEASILVAELKKNVALDLKLVGTGIDVEVTDLDTGNTEIWSRGMFETKLNQLRSYHMAIMNGNFVDSSADPFLSLKTSNTIVESEESVSVLKEKISSLERVNNQLSSEKSNLLVDLNIALAENESLRSKVKKSGKSAVGSGYYKKLKKQIKVLEQEITKLSSKQKAASLLSEFEEMIGDSDSDSSSSDSDNDDFDAMMRKAKSLTKGAVKGAKEVMEEVVVPPPKSGKKTKGEKNQSQICNIQ